MTDRRPHWDDDLIEAVNDAMENNAYHDEMVYAVIAAVEDWQDKQVIGCRYARATNTRRCERCGEEHL